MANNEEREGTQAPIKTAKIRALLARRSDVLERDLAALLGTSPQNFSRKMAIGSFTPGEMDQIAAHFGATWKVEHREYFVLSRGEEI